MAMLLIKCDGQNSKGGLKCNDHKHTELKSKGVKILLAKNKKAVSLAKKTYEWQQKAQNKQSMSTKGEKNCKKWSPNNTGGHARYNKE